MKHLARKGLSLGAVLALLLSGCGNGSAALPETYTIGEESLPALGEIGEPGGEGTACTPGEETQDGSTTYLYTGLASGGAAAQTYVSALVADYGCSVIADDGTIQEEPDFSAEEGDVFVGKDTQTEDGVFRVEVKWSADSCTVSVSLQEGVQVREAESVSLTMEEAVQAVEEMSPQTFGLPGTSMKDYFVYARDGYVMVDEQACFCLDIYDSEHAIQSTCMLSLDGQQLYLLDGETQQVKQLK